jgi:hypothetical protein
VGLARGCGVVERFVERVQVDSDRRVVAVAWDDGYVDAEEAAQQIQHHRVDYLVRMTDGSARRVGVVYGPHGPSLFASWDGGQRNQLLELPGM